MRTPSAALFAALFLWLGPAAAALAPIDLGEVELALPPGAVLPSDLMLADSVGRATTLRRALAGPPASLVIFVDYTCASLCGTALSIVAASLADPALAGLEVGLVAVGLDPKDGVDAAAGAQREHIAAGGPLAARSRFLTADAGTVRALTDAAGYRFRYDPEVDQFAHPAGALLVDEDGRVLRALPSLSLTAASLRLALVDAGEGRVGSLLDRLMLRCYAYDPATGLYTSRVRLLLQGGAILTVLMLVGLILLLVRVNASRNGAA